MKRTPDRRLEPCPCTGHGSTRVAASVFPFDPAIVQTQELLDSLVQLTPLELIGRLDLAAAGHALKTVLDCKLQDTSTDVKTDVHRITIISRRNDDRQTGFFNHFKPEKSASTPHDISFNLSTGSGSPSDAARSPWHEGPHNREVNVWIDHGALASSVEYSRAADVFPVRIVNATHLIAGDLIHFRGHGLQARNGVAEPHDRHPTLATPVFDPPALDGHSRAVLARTTPTRWADFRMPPGFETGEPRGRVDGGWMRAQVKWFNRVSGFGFLSRGSGAPEVVVPMETLRRSGVQVLAPGQWVRVRVGHGIDACTATEIVVDDPPAYRIGTR